MNSFNCIASVGEEYELENRLWKVTDINDDRVKLRCVSRAIEEEYTLFDFHMALYEGVIKMPGLALDSLELPDVRYSDLPKKAKEEVLRRTSYVRRYSTDKHRRSISTKEIIAEVASKIKDTQPPSVRTVERWYKQWNELDEHWIAFVPKKYFHKVVTRLNPIVNDLLIEVLEDRYLVLGANETLQGVKDEIDSRLRSEEYRHLNEKAPEKSTIARRLKQLYDPVEVVRRREGDEAAKRLEYALGEPERASRIMQCIEIDETVTDCFVVDEFGIPIGRPTLVLVVDVYSKMIVGVHVTFLSPSAPVVLRAIKNAILPKEQILSGIDGVVGEWPCHGIPESIRTDNIKHYLSDAFKEAMVDLQIDQEQSLVRSPQGKASVERKFLTINLTHLNRLPGYVQKIEQRIKEAKLDPLKTAILTLDKFNEHLYEWIVNDNNYRDCVGSEKRKPVDVWNESATFYKPRFNRSLDSLEISCMPTVLDRTIQAGKGIGFNGTNYSSPELSRLRTRLMNQKKYRKYYKNPVVKIRWNPDDLGYIWVNDPDTNENFKVETRDKIYHGLTKPLYKCAKELQKQIRKQDGEKIEVKEAVSRMRRELAELTGAKHKVSEKKRKAAALSRLDRKKREEPLVERGDAFAEKINSADDMDFSQFGLANESLDFGPSEYIED